MNDEQLDTLIQWLKEELRHSSRVARQIGESERFQEKHPETYSQHGFYMGRDYALQRVLSWIPRIFGEEWRK